MLDANGQGSLLQVMCGMAFAKNAGAKIINASLGFYAQDPGQAYFFKAFIDRLTTDNTLIIAAAGNADAAEDEQAAPQIGESNLRNLDQHLFYPAAFSASNPNIITVTTVQQSEASLTNATSASLAVAANQNYSATKVQVGVAADNEAYFLNPFGPDANGNWNTWIGSSFAAPKLAGIIAATYYQYLDEKTGWYDRDDYLAWLCDRNLLSTKQAVQTTGLPVEDEVPGHLLMLSQPEYFISVNEQRLAGDGIAG